jgi:hypothetical protein
VLELIPSEIDPFYREAGYMIQDRVYQRIRSVYPRAEQEVTVRTTIEGGETHPDIYIPEINHCIQVKSCSKKFLQGSVSLKAGHKDQVLMEWWFWFNAEGYYIDGPIGELSRYTKCVPTTYEVMYLSREDYGLNYKSLPITYDPMRAQALVKRYEDLAVLIDLEILPEPPVGRCSDCRDCGMNCFE